MNGLLIVPDSLYNAIHSAITKAIKDIPDAEKDRDIFYHEILDYFAENGHLPEIKIEKRS